MSNDYYIESQEELDNRNMQEVMDERFQMLCSALSECKEKGVSDFSIKTIMFECGMPS